MELEILHLRVLTEASDALTRPLSIIFEKLWKSRDVHNSWKKANVTPVFEEDQKDSLRSYRPVSLMLIHKNGVSWKMLLDIGRRLTNSMPLEGVIMSDD